MNTNYKDLMQRPNGDGVYPYIQIHMRHAEFRSLQPLMTMSSTAVVTGIFFALAAAGGFFGTAATAIGACMGSVCGISTVGAMVLGVIYHRKRRAGWPIDQGVANRLLAGQKRIDEAEIERLEEKLSLLRGRVSEIEN